MRPQSVLFSLVLAFIFTAFFSCKDDEVSRNPAHRLSFSAPNDTVFFDTLFAEVPSTTGFFMIYNRNNKPLEISKIELLGGENSYFRLNIPNADEPNSPINHNVFIRGKDSLFVWIALTAPDLDNDEPQKIEDELVFYINGNTQKIKLLAYSQSVIRPESDVNNYDFIGKRPYLIDQDMTINGDANFYEGARIFMQNNVNLIINGNLTINGTQEKPVVIRGIRLDNMLRDVPYDFVPGQWGEIRLTSTNATHNISHAFIRNGKTALTLEAENTRLNVENSWIHNFDNYGIIARNSFVRVANSLITNCGISCVDIAGGESEFTFVTFANYYRSFRPGANNRNRSTPSVLISNYITDESEAKIPAPVSKSDFINCIIYGNFNTELRLNIDEEIPFNYSFSHCLIKMREIENEHFTAILWNENPQFVSTADLLNFRLQENSPVIDKADRSFDILNLFRLDFDANNRYADDAPDIGAFEFVPKINE